MAICVRNKTTSISGVYFFFFDMNFRETKFLDEPSASNRWPQGKAIIRETCSTPEPLGRWPKGKARGERQFS